jgi:hypothetical protein
MGLDLRMQYRLELRRAHARSSEDDLQYLRFETRELGYQDVGALAFEDEEALGRFDGTEARATEDERARGRGIRRSR